MSTATLVGDKRAVAADVRARRARTLALLEDLSPGQWETIVVPRWRVREVAAHLITTDEAALTGRLLALGVRQVPMTEVEAWNDRQVGRWADRPVPALLHALDRWGRRLALALRVPPGPLARAAIPTPFGKVSLPWLGMLRVYDEWVHAEDVRLALGLPGDDSPEAVGPAARFLMAGIPVQTFPRLPADAKGSVAIGYDDLDLPQLGIDFESRRYGVAIGTTGALVRGPAATMIMVAAGREPWREAEARGALTVEGDRAPAETFLDALMVV